MIKIVPKFKNMSSELPTDIVIYDKIWAPHGILINDSKIIRLLNSNAVNNLKYLSQNGASNYITTPFGKKSKTTRYDHSVGCMILTLKLGGTVETAIVALLHDIIHLPFSHTIDYLLGTESESYHENHKYELLKKYEDEFETILGKEWKMYFKEENYPVVKMNNPFAIDICDYTVRDLYWLGLIDDKIIQKLLLFTAIQDNKLVCLTKKSKKMWIKLSKIINDNVYTSAWNTADNYYFSESIKKLMKNNEILKDDIINYNKNTEKNIYDKIKHLFKKEIKHKKFFLLMTDSYDNKIYKKIKQIKMRYRYMNPTLVDKLPVKVTGLIVDLDLVYTES